MKRYVLLCALLITGGASSTMAAPPLRHLVEPTLITSHPAEDYMPALSPKGDLLAFVSTRGGVPNIWLKSLTSSLLPIARPITDLPAGAKDPVFSPDGSAIAFVSYGSDAEGDIYLLKLPDLRELAKSRTTPDIRRITGPDFADRSPLFVDGGNALIYTAIDSRKKISRLRYHNLRTAKAHWLPTPEGAASPALSDDQKWLVYVRNEKLWLHNREERGADLPLAPTPDSLDAFPTFGAKGSLIFVRYATDTNGDGAITIDDTPALYRADVARPDAPALPLTPHTHYTLFPAASGNDLYYTLARDENTDIARLPIDGSFGPSLSPESDAARAEKLARYFANRTPGSTAKHPFYTTERFLYKSVVAAHADCGRCAPVARSLYHLARLEQDVGDKKSARDHFEKLVRGKNIAPPWRGLAAIELVMIAPDTSREEKTRALRAESARSVAHPLVLAAATMAEAKLATESGHAQKGLALLRNLIKQYATTRPTIAAKAAIARNTIYRLTADPERQIAASLEIIRRWPQEKDQVTLAVVSILDLADPPGGEGKRPTAPLARLVEKYQKFPILAAAAQNRMARIYRQAGEPHLARESYRATIAHFGEAERQAAEAWFGLAQLLSEAGKQKEALDLYRQFQRDRPEREELYQKSRTAYINQAIRKATYESEQGELRIALKTWRDLVTFAPETTIAHRGVAQMRVALGQVKKLVSDYEAALTANPGDPVIRYTLGLAYTYLSPPRLDEALTLIKGALAKKRDDPWFHQTAGWLYERRQQKTNDLTFAEKALDEYHYAHALIDGKEEKGQEADLWLNIGNVNYTLGDWGEADRSYTRREAADALFATPALQALFYKKWGECLYRMGDDIRAINRFERARAAAPKKESRLTIEILERAGLAAQSAGSYRKGADYFSASLTLRRANGWRDNETVILRNIANNRYFAAHQGATIDTPLLRQALEGYLSAEKTLATYDKKQTGSGGPALFTIAVQAGEAGVTSGAKGFSRAEEEKLILHHIGKIYGELGEYTKAALYFERKLTSAPSRFALLNSAPLMTERSVILNQLGVYYAAAGNPDASRKKFRKSLALCMTLDSPGCLARNSAALGRLLLEGAADSALEKEITTAIEKLTERENLPATVTRDAAIAAARLGQIAHGRFMAKREATAPPGVAARLDTLRALATNYMTAQKWYQHSYTFFNSLQGATEEALVMELNIARLDRDAGENNAARKRVAGVITRGTGRDRILWRAHYLLSTLGKNKQSSHLKRAAAALLRIPFGATSGDDRSGDKARITTLYNSMAERERRARKPEKALAHLDMGAMQNLRFALAPLLKGIGEGGALEDSLESLMVGYTDWSLITANPGEITSSMKEWRTEYNVRLEETAKNAPTLDYLAHPDPVVADRLQKLLAPGEAALRLWKRQGSVSLFVVTPKKLSLIPLNAKDIVPQIERLDVLRDVEKIFWVTLHPFSDPVAGLLGERYMVASLPALGLLRFYKESRNLNNHSLLVAGETSGWLAPQDTSSFLNTAFSPPSAGQKTASIEKWRRATLVALLSNPTPRSLSEGTPFGATGPTLAHLLAASAQKSLLLAPPPGESEGAYAILALLARFSSWVTLPHGEEEQKQFLDSFLPVARSLSPAEAMEVAAQNGAEPPRLIGAFGFDTETAITYATRSYANNLNAGNRAVTEQRWKDGVTAFEEALVAAGAIGEKRRLPLIYDQLAECHYQLGHDVEALRYQEKKTAFHHKAGENEAMAQSLYLGGIIKSRMGRYPEAIADMQRALTIYRESGMIEETVDLSQSLGLAFEGAARYGAALSSFTEALALNRSLREPMDAALALRRIGRINHLRLGRFDAARPPYDEAIALYQENGATTELTNTLIERSVVEEDAGALAEAEKFLTRAEKSLGEREDQTLRGLIAFHRANIAWFRGAYEEALRHADDALQKAAANTNDHLAALSHNSKGLIWWSLNKFDKALAELELSRQTAHAGNDLLDEASALSNIGLVYRSRGAVAKSILWFERAGIIDRRLKSDWGAAYTARNLSIAHHMQGDLSIARTEADEAVRLTQKIGDTINGAKALLQQGEVAAAEKKGEEALVSYNAALRLAKERGLRDVIWRALRGKGATLAAMGSRSKAITAYRQGVQVVESMRGAIRADELKSGFLDDKQRIYEELILLLLDQGKTTEAFRFAERARARGFIDLIASGDIRLKKDADKKTFERIKAERRKVEELARGGEKNAVAINRAMAELQTSIATIKRSRPDLLPFVAVPPLDITALQRSLAPDVALLEYLVTKNELVTFLLRRDSINAYRTQVGRSAIEEEVADLRHRIQKTAPLGAAPVHLGNLLLKKPLQDAPEIKIFGVAPHGPLHYLSFALLEVDHAPFIERASLFSIPSASVFVHATKRRSATPAARMKALAVGNPDLGSRATALPMAELEATSLGWVFSDVTTLTGEKATRRKVITTAGRYAILHIASHGLFDPVRPLESALHLAPDKEKGDGRLRAADIYGMTINADLVTLSACQTGLGAVSRGDEVTGLNRAFLYAGAHTLLSTLWRVDDLSSALLVKHFYRHLLTTSKAAALRQAQLIIRKRFPHPADWAGFVLVGDYR